MSVEVNIPEVAELILPMSIVSKVDLSRLVTELEQLDGAMATAAVRSKVHTPKQNAPILSQSLVDFLAQNNVSLDDSKVRSLLIKRLRQLKDTVPVISLTFAVTADMDSREQLVQWVRTSVHPQAVLAIGLQPGLIAGVYARTANHVYDMSMRSALQTGRELLVKELGALHGGR